LNPAEIHVHVTPGSRFPRIFIREDPNFGQVLCVHVTARAHDGKANQAVIACLAKHLNIPPSYLRIKRGLTSREKVILLHQP
jgi:uncharacterized protein YggU (UPF0235/DUF167 family)